MLQSLFGPVLTLYSSPKPCVTPSDKGRDKERERDIGTKRVRLSGAVEKLREEREGRELEETRD